MAEVVQSMSPDQIDAQKVAARWIAEIAASEKALEKWLTRARKIRKRYLREGTDAENVNRRFALLWSNTETLRPAVYARPPQPVVSRRFKDADPVAKAASEVLERALSVSVDKNDLDGLLRDAVLDYLLVGRATTWERYVPTHGPAVQPEIPVLQITTDAGTVYQDEDGNRYSEDEVNEVEDGKYHAMGEAYEPVIFEESVTDYVNAEDWGHSPARTWDEVSFVWRRVYMDREQLEDRFGEEIGSKVPLDWGPKKNGRQLDNEGEKRAAIYEIWDKCSKKVFWISKSFPYQALDTRDDPLGLDGFFPCPRPLLATTDNTSLIPTPEYVYYQDQAEEIDELTSRIDTLSKALKVKGFYSGETKFDFNQLFKSDTNVLIPIPDWQGLKEGGGLAGKIEWLPLQQVIGTIESCISLRDKLIEDVYQITGVADILRGASNPNETATAQSIKAQWGSVRVRDRQGEVARFARDILRIKGQVMAEKFGIDTFRAMTGEPLPTKAEKDQLQLQIQQAEMMAQASGQPAPPLPPFVQELLEKPTWEEVKELLESNSMRQFRVDIETDSTIEPNESEEKARTVEFIQAVGGFFAQIGPMVQAQPVAARMFGEIIKFAVRRFRIGRQLEDIIDSTVDQLVEQASQPAPQAAGAAPEPPDTTPIAVAQIDLQREQIKQDGENRRAEIAANTRMAELPLEQTQTQLKGYALARDPIPQGTA